MDLTVENVYALLARSKLLAPEEAQAMFDRWQGEAKDAAADPAKFAAWMVANRYVTEYQAALLGRGFADGFFLNDYKILDRLGKGRMAGVYKAVHRLGQVVAIKVLPPSKAKEPNLLSRFRREGRLAERLKHANIVRTYQLGVADGVHYLVMEYLEGETLEDVLARRRHLAPPEAVRIIYQALRGLQHVHEQGLVHRDLKPANLMLVGSTGGETTLRSTVKLLDIGLGRVLSEERGESRSDPNLTTEGVLLGTPDYMAPEQARDPRAADIRSDIYSLGCVLYHMLAGQPPFPDTNIISQMIRHASDPAPPLRDSNPAVPDGLQQIVDWMMAKDPSARYPTPERAAQALQVFLTAGAEPEEVPGPDDSLSSYLAWLEGEGKNERPARRTPRHISQVKAPVPKPQRAAPAPARERPSGLPRPSHKGKKKAKKEKGRAPSSGSDAMHLADTTDLSEINVELLRAGASKKPGPLGQSVSRRELIAFSLGVGAGAVAAFLGCLLALARRDRTPHDDGDSARGKEP
jgi:serine/threonine protein kinase